MKISRIGEQVIIDGQGDIILCSQNSRLELDQSAHHITITRFSSFPIGKAENIIEKLTTIIKVAKIVFGAE